ncbi:MAG TPA: class I SAM-dependent methyltransferase [Anaerolineae bacterium]|nr:class I SAM-dependent methyltransferase [Anaerolineae bacterium]HIQ04703.1 class I SAM-dependent methyltransferase [Anaerolineae bacterium]
MTNIDYDRFARFYDHDYNTFRADIPFFLGFAQRTGGPLLELACGTGRLLQPLAEAGYQITGVDISPAMLDRARQRLESTGLSERVSLVQADMRDFELPDRYALAFISINSFMHLETTVDQRQALRCWRRHLRPGGLLIIDLFNPNLRAFLEADGRLIVQKQWQDPETGATVVKQFARTLDTINQTLHITFIYDELFPDGTVRRTLAPFTMRYLWRPEAELLLEASGYELEAIYGSYDLEPLMNESERMIFVARPSHG